ncbi:MAG: ABC transporter permease [Bacteroidales bacterium]|nr:ABC transporter permease [Bacteroidales bacterium]
MIVLNLKLALKIVFDKRNSSWISILGLAIAFASLFYIYSYVSFELSYDSQHEDHSRIYRISGDIVAAENTMTHAVLGPSMGQGLKDEFPAVESFVRLIPFHESILLETEMKQFSVDEAYRVDSTIFDIFSLVFLYGSPHSALTNPNEIVINQSLSQKFFGDQNSVGEVLEYDGQIYTIVGVVEDSPVNSHHKLNVLFSIDSPFTRTGDISPVQESEYYWAPSAFHFIMLKQHTEIESITDNFEPFFDKYMSTFGKLLNADFNLIAIPLKDLHFSRQMTYDLPKGNKTYAYILIMVGLFIFLIATINYSNLLVSQTITQAKSVGLRKVLGANQLTLYFQFLLNSLVLILVSVILANIFFQISLPWSKELTELERSIFSGSRILTLSLVFILLTSLTTSLIPFLNHRKKSGLQLLQARQRSLSGLGSIQFGRVSTIVQYALTIVLVISVFVITRQLNFLMKSEMGFDKEGIVMLPLNSLKEQSQGIKSFKEEISKNSSVANASFSSNIPGEILGTSHFQIDRDGETVTKIVHTLGVDYEYFTLMGMEFKEGRNFGELFSDNNFQSVIINEAFIDFCGYNGSMLGVELAGTKVVGVLKNVSFNSLHNPAAPLVFYLSEETNGYLNIKLNTTRLDEAVKMIQSNWEVVYPDVPFVFQFLDQQVAKMYTEDQKINKLIKLFTLISLIISLMGFLNLSTLIMKRKTKEIGIRKVNGATVYEIMGMLNKNFAVWILISFVIAGPIAYYAAIKWLENFAYKTTLPWWIFALSGLLALSIALLTVSWQSWRAATKNPIEALRYE